MSSEINHLVGMTRLALLEGRSYITEVKVGVDDQPSIELPIFTHCPSFIPRRLSLRYRNCLDFYPRY